MSGGELAGVTRAQADFERAYQAYLDAAEERDQAVSRARDAGHKIEPIAKAAGVSRQTVHRILRDTKTP